ncbi:hypothetical protein M9458_003437, partial [Cirrhinus mrigala]
VNLDHETRSITLKNMEQPMPVKFTPSWRKTATLVSLSQQSTKNSSCSMWVKLPRQKWRNAAPDKNGIYVT